MGVLEVGLVVVFVLLVGGSLKVLVRLYRRVRLWRKTRVPREWRIDFEKLQLMNMVGKGGLSEVYRAKYMDGSEEREVAVKLLPRNSDDEAVACMKREMALLMKMKHPNIIFMYGACVSSTHLGLVLEYFPKGSIADILETGKTLDWKLRIKWATEVAHGMVYLHSQEPKVIHRDIKASNILVTEDNTAKISDFGLAQLKQNSIKLPEGGSGLLTRSFYGTNGWIAPELIQKKLFNESVDIYSYGTFLWELLMRREPQVGLDIEPPTHMDLHPPKCPADTPSQYQILMNKCWSTEPCLRPSFDQIVQNLEKLHMGDYHISSPRLLRAHNSPKSRTSRIPTVSSFGRSHAL